MLLQNYCMDKAYNYTQRKQKTLKYRWQAEQLQNMAVPKTHVLI